MSRVGIAVLVLLVFAGIAFALLVRITGPGHRPVVATLGPTPGPVAARPLLIPVQGIAAASLSDSWGQSRGDGARFHHAIDIPAATGTPVVAAADGRIVKLFTSDLGGLTVYQRSADDRSIFYYAHLDHYAPTLVEGEVVKAGTPLGAVGATGDADGGAPHLHFEVHQMSPGEHWWQGREVDPYPLLGGG